MMAESGCSLLPIVYHIEPLRQTCIIWHETFRPPIPDLTLTLLAGFCLENLFARFSVVRCAREVVKKYGYWFLRTTSSKGEKLDHPTFRFSCGNSTTSRIDSAPVSIMTRRSIPIPIPPAEGMPYSSARRKSSSTFCVSSPA